MKLSALISTSILLTSISLAANAKVITNATVTFKQDIAPASVAVEDKEYVFTDDKVISGTNCKLTISTQLSGTKIKAGSQLIFDVNNKRPSLDTAEGDDRTYYETHSGTFLSSGYYLTSLKVSGRMTVESAHGINEEQDVKVFALCSSDDAAILPKYSLPARSTLIEGLKAYLSYSEVRD